MLCGALTPTGGRLEFVGERGCPFLPREMPLFGELDGDGEGLSLPRLGKYGSTLIVR